MHISLGQRLAAGYRHQAGVVLPHFLHYLVDGFSLSAGKRVFSIAIPAAQRATGEANENRRSAGGIGFQLWMAAGYYMDLSEIGLITILLLGVALIMEFIAIRLKSRFHIQG